MRLGTCDRCHVANVWINWLFQGDTKREVCADCFDAVGPVGRLPAALPDPSWQHNPSPWQENAIRDLEEDR